MSSEVEIRAPAEQTEGTRSQILRWLKAVGDTVTENEPLIEIETDKVTVEVASPGSGTLREILRQEQEEIAPGDLLGKIEVADARMPAGGMAETGRGSQKANGDGMGAAAEGLQIAGIAQGSQAAGDWRPLGTAQEPRTADDRTAEEAAAGHGVDEGATGGISGEAAVGAAQNPHAAYRGPSAAGAGKHEPGAAARNVSPAVRRLLAERGLEASEVRGTGQGGRVTVEDVLAHRATGVSTNGAAASGAVGNIGAAGAADGVNARGTNVGGANVGGSNVGGANVGGANVGGANVGGANVGGGSAAGPSRLVPHTATRKRIAEHMVQSLLHTAPHVTTVFEADLTAVLEHRQRNKDDFARRGAPLTLTAYFLQASVAAIRAVPEANSRWTDSALEIFDSVHIGVATALNTGLVVPVLRDVQSRDLFETAKGLEDLVTRAREGRLAPTDVRGGTFTISNHGVSGSLVATPIIINQPQAAILGVGKLEKRPVVSSDAEDGEDRIVIRPRCYVTLTIDHRVMDGHQANQFLQTFVGWLVTSPG